MHKGLKKVCLYFTLGITLQAGIYYYFDQIMFAPTANYNVVSPESSTTPDKSDAKNVFKDIVLRGKAYYSNDYRYMADIAADSVTIYKAEDIDNPQKVELKGKGVSYFEWLSDRNLALMALYPRNWNGGSWDITLARYNPEGTTHESDAPIEDLPAGSKIIDVAFSTATNAVYLKVEVSEGLYRIYRTDANYDTRRIYTQTATIGKIAIFFDEDKFFYDDSDRGIIYLFDGSSSGWRIISPPGRFRLVGLDSNKVIYIAKINNKGEAVAYYTGQLGVGFEVVKELETPVDFNTVTMHLIKSAVQESKQH